MPHCNDQDSAKPLAEPPSALTLGCSRYFINWLQNENIGLAVSTYQTNRLFLFGNKDQNRLSAFERAFDHPTGMAINQDRLILATRYQIWQFHDALKCTPTGTASGTSATPQTLHKGYDRLYIPRTSHTTGDLDIHELGINERGQTVFVNTLYSCLATISDQFSFAPIWTPPFISQLVPEDRCHLNGLAMQDGQPRYVSSISQSDVASGWRKCRQDGGCIIDVTNSEIVSQGLSMPHSPRWHQNKLWVLQSGTGEIGTIDISTGQFHAVAFCPGYLRGLSLYKNFAIVTTSKPRGEKLFSGLSLEARLTSKGGQASCGVWIIDINSGAILHWLEFEGVVSELFDVQVLTNTVRPMALGFRSDEICHTLSFEHEQRLHHHGLVTRQTNQSQAPTEITKGAAQTIHYQATKEFSLQEFTQKYAKLTFPPIALQLESQCFQEPFAAVLAKQGEEVIGLIIAENNAASQIAQVVSWYVLPAYRRQNIGSSLLIRLESLLRTSCATKLRLCFRSSWPNTPALEKIFHTQGWSQPKTWMLLCRGNMELIAKANWVKRVLLPKPYEIFAWSELTKSDRANILERQQKEAWFPPELTPFQEEERIEHLNSVGLRLCGEVVGWMITHRINEDTIQYTTLFVRKDLQPLGRGLALLVTAIQKQMNSPVFKGQCQVEIHSRAMLRYVKKRLMPYLSSSEEIRFAEK